LLRFSPAMSRRGAPCVSIRWWLCGMSDMNDPKFGLRQLRKIVLLWDGYPPTSGLKQILNPNRPLGSSFSSKKIYGKPCVVSIFAYRWRAVFRIHLLEFTCFRAF
jgi:hypothetical protein